MNELTDDTRDLIIKIQTWILYLRQNTKSKQTDNTLKQSFEILSKILKNGNYTSTERDLLNKIRGFYIQYKNNPINFK